MKKFSNNTLLMIAVIAIAISLCIIVLPFGDKLALTGLDVAYVNVTVPSTAEITVWTTSINFTGTNPGDSKSSYSAADVDSREGMPCTTDNHCGMNITNDGSVFINITIQETENLFDSGSYVANTHFVYNVTMQDPLYTTAYGASGNCSVGYAQGLPGLSGWGDWRGVPRASSENAVCYLNNTDNGGACTTGHLGDTDVCPDVARVEFNITVPGDEVAGDKAGTITFTAIAS